jgi:hypothetical protein
MNTIKRYVRLTGFIATLAAGLVLSAAIDGAGAKDQAREGSGANSSSIRKESRSLPEKPVETGAKPVGNSPPIIAKRDHGDRHDHGDKHDHAHKHDRGHRIGCECLYPPCPKIKCDKLPVASAPGSKPIPIDPGTGGVPGRVAKPIPIDPGTGGSAGPVAKPVLTDPGYGVPPARGGAGGGNGGTSASTSKHEQ